MTQYLGAFLCQGALGHGLNGLGLGPTLLIGGGGQSKATHRQLQVEQSFY